MEPNHHRKLKRTLLISMILLPVIPFVLALATGYHYFTTSLENNAIAAMQRIVIDHRQMIDSFLTERRADLSFIAHCYTFDYLRQPDHLATIFKNLQIQSNVFTDLGVFNAEGVHVAYQGPYPLLGKVYKDADWFRQALQNKFYISDVFLGYRHIPHFVIAVAQGRGENAWVLRATIDTTIFSDIVETVRIGKTGEAFILNAEARLQTQCRSGGQLLDRLSDSIQYPSPNTSIQTFIERGPENEAFLYATTYLEGKKWLLVVRQEKSDAFSAIYSASYAIVLITVIGGAVLIGVAIMLSERIAASMQQLDMEKQQINLQLIGATRLAELGEMAAGFAHEINNPLQIIRSEHTLIEMDLSDLIQNGRLASGPEVSEIQDSLNQIKLQIGRCAKITQAILKFGRQDPPVAVPIDLAGFIAEITQLIHQKAMVENITVVQDIDARLGTVIADPAQLQQVFLNLLNNAIDAIIARRGADGGRISISAGPHANGFVDICIADNGIGIDTDQAKKIFSPFFTTKPVGKGTGLGLSVCYGIIDQMGGTLAVSSQAGHGAAFTIHLPASSRPMVT